MNQEANPYRVREVVTLEKFEMEESGRRLVEIIRVEDGVVTSMDHPTSENTGG